MEHKCNHDDYDDSNSDINSSNSSSVSSIEDNYGALDYLDIFMHSELPKEYINDKDGAAIGDWENIINQLISIGAERASSLTNNAINKTGTIRHDTQAEHVQSNGCNADLISHNACRRDSKGGSTNDKTHTCLLCRDECNYDKCFAYCDSTKYCNLTQEKDSVSVLSSKGINLNLDDKGEDGIAA